MHTFKFRVEEKSHHLDGQTIISLTELHTRIGAKFHPNPLHRMASIQLSTFGLDLNQYQLGQTVELKMSIVTKIDEPVSAPVFSPPVPEIAPSTLTETKKLLNLKSPEVVESNGSEMTAIARRLAINNFWRNNQYKTTNYEMKQILHLLDGCLATETWAEFDLNSISVLLRADLNQCYRHVLKLREYGILRLTTFRIKTSKGEFQIDWKSLLSPENSDRSSVPTKEAHGDDSNRVPTADDRPM